MPRTIFVTLPMGDVARSSACHEATGFTKDGRCSNEQGSAMQWSDENAIKVLSHDRYSPFMLHKAIADASTTSTAILFASRMAAMPGQAEAA